MRSAIALPVLASLLAATAVAAAPGRLDKSTFMDMESVSTPSISPDGRRIVFSRTRVDKTKDVYRSTLWIAESDGSRIRELTTGDRDDSAPVWSPDGSRIAFLSDRDGTAQLFVMYVDSRELAQLTSLEHAPSNIRWSPDGRQIAFTAFVPDKDTLLNIRLPEKPKGAEWAKPAVLVDRLSWAADGRGPLTRGHTHVYTVDAVLGGTPRQVTSGKYDHSSFDWAPDGRTMYVSGIRKPDAEYLRNDSEIYAVDLGTLAVTPLTDRKGPDGSPRVSPDGRWIAYVGYDERSYTNHVSSVHIMRRDGSGKALLAGGLDSSPQNLEWSANGQAVYFTVGTKGRTDVCSVSPSGGKPQRASTGTMLNGVSYAPRTGQFAAVSSTLSQPSTIVTFRAGGKGGAAIAATRLVDVNTDVLDGVALGAWEELWFKSKDGLDVQGWLVKPAGFEQGKKYPMVLWIHGGPWSMYSTAWNWAFQNFSAEGYAVLFTNPRGSTGYGQEFVNGIQYSYPGRDYDDLMAGVDAAIARGFVDERNLFVCGGSGGGVLTAWIVGHTDRFAAAVAMRPVINWHSFVGTTDGPNWYHQFRKYPWEDPAEFAARSPLTYVANVTTPTMVMTGEADLRTPIAQSEEYYRALKMLKKETLLVRMPDEYHGWRRPSHQLAQQLYLQAWFRKHARSDPASGEKATAGN
jgi:dipeptidyl aminopeptidase/acylaminoacyl peptidase